MAPCRSICHPSAQLRGWGIGSADQPGEWGGGGGYFQDSRNSPLCHPSPQANPDAFIYVPGLPEQVRRVRDKPHVQYTRMHPSPSMLCQMELQLYPVLHIFQVPYHRLSLVRDVGLVEPEHKPPHPPRISDPSKVCASLKVEPI